ncbi:uncharacterized protein OCT59_003534 [Rhizophagus irregularis]|uniref:Uncharacterized protein n=2 Tax=Rhizophagus irregularis TaxID=588596 RepID=U9TF97_RHIID|nr:hypothetical protein GLOIN_2v1781313 [Rhizophagus irregularis DAOM 181602=DAOM 197198]EXX70539.1 hypothetical protein RirG_086470 [Rhizophagus irregularis DAOM 197198w]UZO11983.1 hypothetical protein OCT59_003534 [Rhizophagus irregularis]POG65849.1 hypothetical protein GLOIN_2v1781313 [Rhizophagus irregularis DAOM 181602=DAOM 197198]CAG8653034.1 41_t:CDS:1 [Rhizophagus irregularis]GBC37518.2 hypothetical protein GLOIN_2v1781313 [Rhizophagus irregularis DAOM 181602=DAOM 197198]|eukprot:XP_025172715.1 hypothetical protein GLOIN_2v1781313 [Rhizophagus irregularis DAOM 181602=DAOM 197198]
MDSNNHTIQDYSDFPMSHTIQDYSDFPMNHTTQDYSDFPMNKTENSFAPLQVLDNRGNEIIQHTLINNDNVEIPNINLNTLHDTIDTLNTLNTATSMTQNTIFEFYFHLPNDTRIFHVTYSELHPSENIRLLNNSINLSHIPDYQFPHHYNVQSLVRQQIQQRVQQPFDIMRSQPTPQVYLETTSTGNIFDNMQDMVYDGVPNDQNNP